MLRVITEAQSTWMHVRKFIKDQSGATAIEYGLIAAGIAVAIIGTVFALGEDINTYFQQIQTDLANNG